MSKKRKKRIKRVFEKKYSAGMVHVPTTLDQDHHRNPFTFKNRNAAVSGKHVEHTVTYRVIKYRDEEGKLRKKTIPWLVTDVRKKALEPTPVTQYPTVAMVDDRVSPRVKVLHDLYQSARQQKAQPWTRGAVVADHPKYLDVFYFSGNRYMFLREFKEVNVQKRSIIYHNRRRAYKAYERQEVIWK